MRSLLGRDAAEFLQRLRLEDADGAWVANSDVESVHAIEERHLARHSEGLGPVSVRSAYRGLLTSPSRRRAEETMGAEIEVQPVRARPLVFAWDAIFQP